MSLLPWFIVRVVVCGALMDFLRQVHRKVSHPNIMHHVGSMRVCGWNFITYEYVRGRTLSSYVQLFAEDGWPFTRRRDSAEVVLQVAAAVAYLSLSHIAHGDLQPENIMLRRDESGRWRVKLVDFGCSGPLSGISAPHGASLWVPADGQNPDVFSLGKIATALFSGQWPRSSSVIYRA